MLFYFCRPLLVCFRSRRQQRQRQSRRAAASSTSAVSSSFVIAAAARRREKVEQNSAAASLSFSNIFRSRNFALSALFLFFFSLSLSISPSLSQLKNLLSSHRWIDTISHGVFALSTLARVDSSQALCVDPGSTLCSELSWMYWAAPFVVEYLLRVLFLKIFFRFSSR